MIAIENLYFAYPDGPSVLEDISFNVQAGEILGVLGPNGSGKTTLLHLMSSLLIPQAGKILLNDRSLENYSRPELARHIALVPQKDAITLPFSIWEIVLMGRQPYHRLFGFDNDEDRRLAEQALQATDLEGLKERSIQSLSGGERRRVLIARALSQSTPILLMDEPTAHLDIHYQMEISELLLRLRNDKRHTIVMTLHDINLAALFCDRILILSDRKIHQIGGPCEVITEKTLTEVFRVPVEIRHDEKTGRPFYRPLRDQT